MFLHPAFAFLEATDEAVGIGVTKVSGVLEHDAGLPERNGGAGVGEIGILRTEVRRRTGDEQPLRIVLEVRQTGIVKQRIGVIDYRRADIDRKGVG